MMLLVTTIIFISLLLTNKAGAFPPFPPVGSTGAGGGECNDPAIPNFSMGGDVMCDDTTSIATFKLSTPCPEGKKAKGTTVLCLRWKEQPNPLPDPAPADEQKFFSYTGTCTNNNGGSTFTTQLTGCSALNIPPVDDNTKTVIFPTGESPQPQPVTHCVQGFACSNTPAPYNNFRNLLAGDALKGEDSFVGTEDEVLEFFEKCGKYDYEGLLHVTDHLYALGIPSEEAKQANCPYIMINGLVGNREDPMSMEARKEIKFWSNKEDFEEAFPSTGSLSFGFFLGAKVSEAFHKADVTTPGFLHYDAIKNNCGTFIINLANELDVKIDGKVTSFVARRLLEKAGEELVNQFRNSVHFPSLFDGHNRQLRGDVIDGEQLVELVVESTAADLLN